MENRSDFGTSNNSGNGLVPSANNQVIAWTIVWIHWKSIRLSNHKRHMLHTLGWVTGLSIVVITWIFMYLILWIWFANVKSPIVEIAWFDELKTSTQCDFTYLYLLNLIWKWAPGYLIIAISCPGLNRCWVMDSRQCLDGDLLVINKELWSLGRQNT